MDDSFSKHAEICSTTHGFFGLCHPSSHPIGAFSEESIWKAEAGGYQHLPVGDFNHTHLIDVKCSKSLQNKAAASTWAQ